MAFDEHRRGAADGRGVARGQRHRGRPDPRARSTRRRAGRDRAATSRPEPSKPTTHVRFFAVDGSTFLDGDYLIKGVSGRILWSLLGHFDRERPRRVHQPRGPARPVARAARVPRQLREPADPAQAPARRAGRADPDREDRPRTVPARGRTAAATRTSLMSLLTAGEAVVLGMVEGVTEFLPISSTGHLLVASRIMGLPDSGAAGDALKSYEIAIQFGAILAVLLLYRRRVGVMVEGLLGRSEQGRQSAHRRRDRVRARRGRRVRVREADQGRAVRRRARRHRVDRRRRRGSSC